MSFQTKLKSLQPRRLQFQKKIKLLSGGYAKRDSFPGGDIIVYPWDASVDDWLADRGRKGDQKNLLYDLCAHLCDLKGCPIDQFVLGDVNTVLLVARAIRFNSIVEYEYQCPSCGAVGQEEIAVPDELGRMGEKSAEYPGYDEIVLPDVQDQVKIRPLHVKDEKSISSRSDDMRRVISDRVMHILMPVVAINNGPPDNVEQVHVWYNALSPKDSAFLESQQNELYPHLDTSIPHGCDKCGKKFKHTLDFSAEFFRASLQSGDRNPVEADVRFSLGERGEIIDKSKGGAGPDPGPNGGVGK